MVFLQKTGSEVNFLQTVTQSFLLVTLEAGLFDVLLGMTEALLVFVEVTSAELSASPKYFL